MPRLSLFMVCCLWSLASARSAPELPPSAVSLFQQRFDALTKSYDLSLTSHQTRIKREKNPAGIASLKAAFRYRQLTQHRRLLILETDLILLATPADSPDPDQAPSSLSSSTRRRVAGLRQDIRDDERERITEALEKGEPLHADERTAKSIDRDQQSLDALFERATSGCVRDIEKARRDIGREQRSNITDDDEIAELEQEIKTSEASVAELHLYFYGHKSGSGFDHDPRWPAGHAAEQLRGKISSARQAILKSLRDEGENAGENSAKGGLVGGSYVYSANLGVVLDVSGSMSAFIDPLKKEIAETFSGPRYREIPGCNLSARGFNTNETHSFTSRGIDTMSVIEELIVVHGVDTIYWFCDLRDQIDITALRRLRYLFRHGGTAFHVKSVGQSPKRELKALIDDFQR